MSAKKASSRVLLWVLFVLEIGALALFVLRPFLLEGAFFAVMWLLGGEFVHRDAVALNRRLGSKVLNPSLWSFLALLIVTIPFYISIANSRERN